MTRDPKPLRNLLPLWLLAGFVVVLSFIIGLYRPDRPVAGIVPGSSSGPAFVVQIIRPRTGLPLGGILPPQFFGQAAHLGFDVTSPGASVGGVDSGRIELGADGWDLVLAYDDDGRVTAETQVTFEIVLAERLRSVRCRPGDPAEGSLDIFPLNAAGELSGSFDIELARCDDEDTGRALGWPTQPLVLHGSFDRLPLAGHAAASGPQDSR